MSIKQRLFGPRWQHKDAGIRLQAVSESNDPQLFEQLSTIAHTDDDAKVRLAALRRLDHENQWLKTSRQDPDEKLRRLADEWLLKAVCEADGGERLGGRMEWLKRIESGESIRHIAGKAKDAEVRSAALARIQAQGFLGDCYASDPDDQLAAELLQRIDQPSTLKRIADRLRKTNKDRHHAVLQRLAALESGSDQGDQNSARNELARQLLEQLEQLARGARSDNRAQQIERIQHEWAQLPEPDASLTRRYQGALRILQLAMTERVQPAPADLEDPPASDEPDPGLVKLTDRLHDLIARRPEKDHGRIKDVIHALNAEFDRAWNTLEAKPANAAIKQHFSALMAEHRARAQAQEAPTKKAEPPAHDPVPEWIDQLNQKLEAVDQAIESGDVAKSQEAVSSAQSLFDRIPKKRRPQALSGKLTRMHGRLNELRNWQHWSNNELRERLIERVAEIDVENLHPDAVTERLKELRQRWKALDALEAIPGSKRRYGSPHSQWRRFQKATDEVYEAARPYLEKRDEVRQQSLGELIEFLDEAEPLAEKGATDHKLLIRYQRAARQAIRHLHTLPAKQRGAMAGRLRGLMDSISKTLDAQFDQNEQEKRRLIAEARKLEYEKDRDTAIELAKSLQARWKKIPPARRKIDQTLWQEFRQPIDPLFEGLKQEREQQQAEDRERTQALQILCEQAEQLADSKDAALDAAAGPIAGLEEQWAQQPAPPALNKRFNQALEKYQRRLSERAKLHEQQKIAHLQALTEALQNAWNQRAAGKGTVNVPETQVADDDALGQKLKGRLTEFCDPGSDDSALAARVEGLTDQARQIAIEMETLSGLETPEADRKQRMDYQVQRLSERLGQGSSRPDLSSEREELHRRWLQSFPHAPDQHKELKKRFEAGDKILKNMTSK